MADEAESRDLQDLSYKLFSSIGDIARVASLFVALLYVAGLFILNVDLGRQGIVDLELARPEFVLIGAMWFLLTVSPVFLFLYGRDTFRKSRRDGVTWRNVKSYGTVLGSAAVFLVFALVITRFDLTSRQTARYFIVIAISGYLLIPVKRDRMTLNRAIARGKFAPTATWLVIELGLFFIGTLGLYSLFVFPYIAKEFGGGYRPLVQLILSNSSEIPWDRLSIKVSPDGRVIGPVRLIFENQSEIVVAASDLRDLLPPNSLPGQPIDVVIDKKNLAATLYIALQDTSRLRRLVYTIRTRVLGMDVRPEAGPTAISVP